MKTAYLTLVIILFGLMTSAVSADTQVRTGSQFALPQGQTIDGNFFGVGNPVVISGEITEDATLVGNRVTVTGTVAEDLLLFSILAGIDGTVQEDARVFGANAVVSGTVEGDLMVVGGTVDILSDATIGGDVLLYGGTVQLSGEVGGNVFGAVQSLTINGSVGEGVDVHVSELTLGATASVTEAVRYTSSALVNQHPNTIVGGSVFRNDPVYTSTGFTLGSVVYPALILLLSVSIWYVLSRQTLTQVVTQTTKVLPRSAVTGMIVFIVTPLIVFVLGVSLFGGYLWVVANSQVPTLLLFFFAVLPILIVLFGYLAMVLLSVLAVPALLGRLCLYLVKDTSTTVSFVSLCLGSFVCMVLLLLPLLGPLLLFFVAILLLGGLLEGLVRASK